MSDIVDSAECWNWSGTFTDYGYGVVPQGGKMPKKWNQSRKRRPNNELAHRLSYVLANGEIPKGFVVHHKCDNKTCVRPSHLELLSKSEHSRLNGKKTWLRLKNRVDIVEVIINAYKSVDTKAIQVGAERSPKELWDFVLTSTEAQLREARVEWNVENYIHMKKELVDAVLVILDWFHRAGDNPYKLVIDRCNENEIKIRTGNFHADKRTVEFYRRKCTPEGIPDYIRKAVHRAYFEELGEQTRKDIKSWLREKESDR